MTPEQRVLRAKIGAHALHARHNGHEITKKATEASQHTRFERQVDPNNELLPEERTKRAAHARSAYMRGLALRRSMLASKRKSVTVATTCLSPLTLQE